LCPVVFDSNIAADACDRAIDVLRHKLAKPPSFEFHFSHSSNRVRKEFLATVNQDDFKYCGFVLNKRKLYGAKFTDPRGLYKFAVKLTCEQMRVQIAQAKVVIDKSGNREFKDLLGKSLRAHMTDRDGTCRVRKVSMEASHSNNLVQLVDMICGAVGRSFTAKDDSLRKLVKRHEKFVQSWQ
jgi:hypothetical protein